jgi:hypothetical protein
MPTLAGGPTNRAAMRGGGEADAVTRGLRAAYARSRLEEAIRAIAEDALDPGQIDSPSLSDDARFEDDLLTVVREIAELANDELAGRLTDLLDAAPPRLVARLASAPRFPDPS